MVRYRYSQPVSAGELQRWGAFTTMEVRNHMQEEFAHQGSREFVDDVSKAWDCKISWKSCSQSNGHLMALCVPECLPERLGLLSAICDMSFLQDDIFENTTDVQREDGAPDGFGEFQSVLAQKGLPNNSLAMFPKLKKDIMKKILAKDPSLASWIPQEVDRVAKAPPRDRMTYDTLESFMDERLRDVSMKWFYDLCAYGIDLRLTEEEHKQAYLPKLAMEKAIIYTNDLFSWAKEKSEQETVAASKDMFSAVAVLMKEYKVSEKEALDLLREKTIECEKDHWVAVADLEKTGPLSENLYRYLDMTRLCHSGGMLWSAFTDRYNGTNIVQVNGDLPTKERAPLSSPPVEHLDKMGSSPSIMNGSTPNGIKPISHGTMNGTIHVNGNGVKLDGPGHLSNGEAAADWVDGDGTSLIAHGKDIALAPYDYVRSLPSKGIREILIDSLNLWLQVPEMTLERIRNIVVMLHTSSLMLDDIEDNSKLRRGMPSAHVIYGESQTINSASYVQTRAFAEAAKLGNPISVSIFCEEIENLYIGQSLDLHWKHHVHYPSEKEYIQMVDGKTGGLFRMILGLMQAESSSARDCGVELRSLIQGFGRYFQIRDDYQNIASSDYARQKGSCEDLDEGKISILLIHSMQQSSRVEQAQIKGIFEARGSDGLLPQVKTFVVNHLDQKTDSLAYTRGMLKELEAQLMDDLILVEKVSGVTNPLLRSLLAKLEL